MIMENELDVIKKAKTNIHYFDQIYSFYYSKIYTYIFYRVLNEAIAEDIASSVFIKAIEKIKQFDSKKSTSLRPWLYTIAHNKIIDHFRKVQKQNTVEWENGVKDDFANKTIDIEQRITIVQTLKKLSPIHQQVLSLKYFEGFSNKEIAKIINKSHANTRVTLTRAQKAFKEKYNNV
jgi:RNA polymerase sigma-70 factor (ECF subfamily)